LMQHGFNARLMLVVSRLDLGGGAFIPVKATIVSITTNHNNCDGITSDKA